MDHLLDERREMARTLNAPGAKPDPSLRISRRTFLHKSLVTTGVTGVTPLPGALGQAGTTVIYGDSDIGDGPRSLKTMPRPVA